MGLQVISVLLKICALRLGNVTVEALVDSLLNFLFLEVKWINFFVYPANSAYAPEVRATYQGFQLHLPFASELPWLLDRDKKASLKESPWMTEIRSGWSLTPHRADLLVLFTFRSRSPAWTQVEEDSTSLLWNGGYKVRDAPTSRCIGFLEREASVGWGNFCDINCLGNKWMSPLS